MTDFGFSYCGLFAVVDDPVNHAIIIFYGQLYCFQIVLRPEIGKLLEADAVAVVVGYHTGLLQSNDVADGQAVPSEISGSIPEAPRDCASR